MMYDRKISKLMKPVFLAVVFFALAGFSACGGKPSAHFTQYNFSKDNYKPEYNTYEEIIEIEKNQKEDIDLEVNVTSGSINVKIYAPDGALEKEFTVEDLLSESIPVSGRYGEWKAIATTNEESEGSFIVKVGTMLEQK